ncbi:MAG: hypothetical protein ACK4SX_11890 [Alcanivoracaceae bacterium]
MKKLVTLFLVLLSGCHATPRFDVYPNGERIVVKSGYSVGPRKTGQEYVFSVILPDDEWTYSVNAEATLKGYLKPYGQESQRTLGVEWIWIDRESADTLETISEKDPYYLPWYSGIKGDGTRILYRPTENQLRYGDWHRGGYPQTQFRQVVYKGKEQFYCVRTVNRRGRYTRPPEEYTEEYFAQIREGQYGVFDTCPFRTTDGRDAYFKISVRFNVSDEDIAANPAIIEGNLQALDEWLKPLWDSLEIMPTAYQFTAP